MIFSTRRFVLPLALENRRADFTASGMAGSSKVGKHTRRIERLSARRTHSIPNRKHESHGAGRRLADRGLSTTKRPRNGPSTCRACLRASRPALGRFSAPNRHCEYRWGWMSWWGAATFAVSLLTPALLAQKRGLHSRIVVQDSTAYATKRKFATFAMVRQRSA